MSAEFDEFGGTLGRGPDCSLVLTDDRRGVSRVHCKIEYRDGCFKAVDNGTNPTKVNGIPLGKGNATEITGGDRLVIGPYELEVTEGAASSGQFDVPAHSAPANPSPPPASTGDPDNPFADLLGGDAPQASPADPPSIPGTEVGGGILDDLDFGAEAPAPDPLASEDSNFGALPDDFDPLAPETDKKDALPPAGAGLPDDAFSDFDLGPEAPDKGSLDDMFDLSSEQTPDPLADSPLGKPPPSHSGGTDSGLTQWIGGEKKDVDAAPVSDHLPEFESAFEPPKAVTPALPPDEATAEPASPPSSGSDEASIDDLLGEAPAGTDPLAGFTDPVAEPEPAAPPPKDNPPSAIPPEPRPTLSGPAPVPKGTSNAPPTELVAALMQGLQAPELSIDELTPELMLKLGTLLHEATSGTVALLAARGSVKREMRADVTMIASGRNNPLKFSPDGAMALRYMLGAPMPGFMEAEESMRDAYSDLRAHEFGFMAGLRAALADVLARFDPERIEQRLPEKGGVSGLLSSNRKARLWEHFGQLHQDISQEAEEDFHALFGREFIRAYEEHIKALERAKKK